MVGPQRALKKPHLINRIRLKPFKLCTTRISDIPTNGQKGRSEYLRARAGSANLGAVVIPAALRRRFGIEEGSLLIAEGREEGIFLSFVLAVPLESYSPERKAEFLLSNAVDGEDYARAEEEEVRKLGLDPATIPHRRP